LDAGISPRLTGPRATESESESVQVCQWGPRRRLLVRACQ
jgi:hypothetical protein